LKPESCKGSGGNKAQHTVKKAEFTGERGENVLVAISKLEGKPDQETVPKQVGKKQRTRNHDEEG